LIPKEILEKNFDFGKEEDFETSKVLTKKLMIPMNLLYDKEGE